MRNYDFKSLNDKDFEILACDLLSIEHGVRFERFKQGKDGGIDGRYYSATGGQVILQCKHWARATVADLIRSLKSTELPKVTKLNPQQYLLVTSLELSQANKKAIKDTLAPFIISESDIFGKEDLNDLLGQHEDIERQHYKLWLSGTNVLESILHSAILGRSDFAVKAILERSSKYVTTAIHQVAEDKLAKQRVVIIVGEAGVGKTTLAEQLCLQYVQNDFQLVVIGDSIEEAEALIRDDKPQIFYFDDFLGRNYLFALNRHEDTHIVSFIKRIEKDISKRFVLTSRTNVLNQGKRLTDTFAIAKIDRTELEVRVSALKPYEKASLLYSHIWFTELNINYVEEILRDKRYRTIIEHKNFNPRLISFITDPQRLSDVVPSEYWNYIQGKLNNPADVWEHTYESQLDDYSRAIVLFVVLNGGVLPENNLRDAYYRILGDQISAGYSGNGDFNLNIRTLSGSLLNRNINQKDGEVSLSLFNPSVADYVINRIKDNQQLIEAILLALASQRGINNLTALFTNSIVSPAIAKKCFCKLASQHLPNTSLGLTAYYKLNLIENALPFIKDDIELIKIVVTFLNNLSSDEVQNEFLTRLLGEVLRPLLAEQMISEVDAWIILTHIKLESLDRDELEALAPICQLLSAERKQEFTENLRETILAYWEEFITDEIRDVGTLTDYYDLSDRDNAVGNVCSEIYSLLEKYELPFTQFDIDSILENCDIDQIISDNITREAKSSYGNYKGSSGVLADDGIDDLFTIDLPFDSGS